MHSDVQYWTAQYSTVLYSTVQYCTVLYSTVLYSTVLYSTVLYSTVLNLMLGGPILKLILGCPIVHTTNHLLNKRKVCNSVIIGLAFPPIPPPLSLSPL